MDETTLKTVENAVVICAESAKNATESATKALDANMKVETLVSGIDDKVRTAANSATAAREAAEQVAAIKGEVEGLKNNAVIEATKAANAAATAVTASTSASLTVTQVTTLAKRAEDAAQTAQNGAAFCEEMQDEIGATKTKIDATAKVVQANADAVAGAKKEIDTAISTANTTINGAVERAETAKGDAVKAQGEASKSAEQASTAAFNASKSAEQAEQAKTAIGDVGGRLEAVETSVEGKQPYISPLMLSLFDYKRYDFTVDMAALFPRVPCHEGFICYAQYKNIRSRYFGVDGKDIPFPVNANDSFRLTIIGKDETVVYAENNGKYKFTIRGRGDAVTITHEVLSAFPENIGSYSKVVGWLTSNGYIVTTNGQILDGTTLAEVSTFSYSGTHDKILKNGDTFYYKDTSTHQFTTMTVGDDGVPALSVNGYKQNSAINFYPIDKDIFVAVWHSRVVGVTNANGHLYDNSGGDDTFLGVASVGFARLVFTINDVYCVYQGETDDGGYKRVRAASNILMQDDVFFANNYGYRGRFACIVDAKGNIFITNFTWYIGKREFVHVFKNKEA